MITNTNLIHLCGKEIISLDSIIKVVIHKLLLGSLGDY